VDSSLLTWLAGTLGDVPVSTFSVAFEEPGFDESPFSRLVARTFGTRHEEVLVTMDAATDACLELTRHLDEPFADASCIPTYILARHARASVKTVLTGEGADELFGGNPWHAEDGADTESLGRVLAAPSKVVFTEPQLDRVCSDDLRAAMAEVPLRPTPEMQAAFARCARGLERRLWADLHFYLPSDLLTKADRTTMRASLEARVPYLNHPLVEYAWSLPSSLRLRNGRRKYALKRLGEGHLPPEILERDKKGFSIPLDLWLWRPGRFRDMVWEVLLDDRTRGRGQFAMDAVETMLRDHDRLRAFHGYQLWTLFVFEVWQRHFLDQPARVPA
jgi:asparagine synthase (glutamine-hydrolysing)